MNWRVLLILVLLADFAVVTGWAMSEVGYVGIFAAGLSGPGAIQILVDLVIVCGLAMVWMVFDAGRHGLNPWPYVLLTVFAGSFGPLVYLLRREWGQGAPAPSTV